MVQQKNDLLTKFLHSMPRDQLLIEAIFLISIRLQLGFISMVTIVTLTGASTAVFNDRFLAGQNNSQKALLSLEKARM